MLWTGPYEEGISFSLLSKFLVCRHRFYLKTITGVEEDEGFNHKIEYGSMFHCMIETLGDYKTKQEAFEAKDAAVDKYCQSLIQKYPESEAEIIKWKIICKGQYRIYYDYWTTHRQWKGIKRVFHELDFKIPYKLPSGRTINMRGKIDGGVLPGASFMIEETKTKGRIDDQGIGRTLKQNLQTMFYRTAWEQIVTQDPSYVFELVDSGKVIAPKDFKTRIAKNGKIKPCAGVAYNVIRRPLSDFRSIRQKKAETDAQFLKRLNEKIAEDPAYNFMRWRVRIKKDEVTTFQQTCLDPILEQLCDWWEWVAADPEDPFRIPTTVHDMKPSTIAIPGGGIHWQAPFGVYNGMYDGYRGDYYDFLTTGSTKNLVEITNLFPELENE